MHLSKRVHHAYEIIVSLPLCNIGRIDYPDRCMMHALGVVVEHPLPLMQSFIVKISMLIPIEGVPSS